MLIASFKSLVYIMTNLPNSLEETINQAKSSVKAALADGETRIQVELVIPEIALQSQLIAWQFADSLSGYGFGMKVIFVDTGAAALARRDWGETPFRIGDLGSRFTSIETKIEPEDQIYLIVSPSAVEVASIEKLFSLVLGIPVILLIPQLEDIAIVGLGYAARQLRERFLSTLYTCYYFRPMENAMVLRVHGSPWQVYLDKEGIYELIYEGSEKPVGEILENLFVQEKTEQPKNSSGVLNKLQKFLRALSQ